MTAAEFRAARIALNLSVQELAIDLGVSWRTIYRWEAGSSPVNSTAAKLIMTLERTTQ
jgi:DNA-binding transcriptional regulator YiaG